MKNIRILLIFASIVMISGCAKWSNEIAADGGLIGSYNGNYVIRNDSGGRIMDVWVLTNRMVQSEQSGSGWFFQDNAGDVVHLGGDVKVIRVNSAQAGNYHEYHAEFESKTYQELYGNKQ